MISVFENTQCFTMHCLVTYILGAFSRFFLQFYDATGRRGALVILFDSSGPPQLLQPIFFNHPGLRSARRKRVGSQNNKKGGAHMLSWAYSWTATPRRPSCFEHFLHVSLLLMVVHHMFCGTNNRVFGALLEDFILFGGGAALS